MDRNPLRQTLLLAALFLPLLLAAAPDVPGPAGLSRHPRPPKLPRHPRPPKHPKLPALTTLPAAPTLPTPSTPPTGPSRRYGPRSSPARSWTASCRPAGASRCAFPTDATPSSTSTCPARWSAVSAVFSASAAIRDSIRSLRRPKCGKSAPRLTPAAIRWARIRCSPRNSSGRCAPTWTVSTTKTPTTGF